MIIYVEIKRGIELIYPSTRPPTRELSTNIDLGYVLADRISPARRRRPPGAGASCFCWLAIQDWISPSCLRPARLLIPRVAVDGGVFVVLSRSVPALTCMTGREVWCCRPRALWFRSCRGAAFWLVTFQISLCLPLFRYRPAFFLSQFATGGVGERFHRLLPRLPSVSAPIPATHRPLYNINRSATFRRVSHAIEAHYCRILLLSLAQPHFCDVEVSEEVHALAPDWLARSTCHRFTSDPFRPDYCLFLLPNWSLVSGTNLYRHLGANSSWYQHGDAFRIRPQDACRRWCFAAELIVNLVAAKLSPTK